MRALLPALAGAQALGIFLADRLEPSSAACWGGAGALVLGAAGLRDGRARAAAILAVAALAGAASLAGALETAHGASAAPREAVVEATAREVHGDGPSLRVDWGDARAERAPAVPRRLRTWSALEPGLPAALQAPLPGERWRFHARLRRIEGRRNPGAPDAARALARRGIGASGGRTHPALGVRRVSEAADGPARRLHAWRAARAERLLAAGPGGALLAALGLGERRGLSDAAREAFARLGLAHLLAVSGLHLALVGGASFAAARVGLARVPGLAARRDVRPLAVAAALPAAAAYAALSGWGVPVQRAWLLLGAVGLAWLVRRPRRRAAPLALAASFVLAGAPHALFEAGFQLSFAATAGLLWARPPQAAPEAPAGRGARLAHAGEGLLRASAAALLATGPVVAAHFGAGPPFGLLANLLAIPATAFGLLPASALAVVAAGGEGALARGVLGLAERLAAAALAAVAASAEALGPTAASPPVRSPGALGVAGALAVVGVRRAGTGARLALLALQAAWLAFAPPPEVAPGPPRFVALDVGQGDALLVQGRRGVLVVDAGRRLPSGWDAGERVAAPALAALGVARIDRLAVSHADLDHRGGVPALLARVPVGAVWLPPGGLAQADFAVVRAAAARASVPVLERAAGDPPERLGDLVVSFLWPPRGLARERRNDGSLVLRVEPDGGASLLLPGDVGRRAEVGLLERGAPLAADVLLLPHHGSRTSAHAAFLAAVDPRLAVVSAPCFGRFPLPAPEVRARLAGRDVPLAWTGRDGAVIVGLAPRLRARAWGAPRPGCFGTARRGAKRPALAVLPGETR